MPKVVNFYLDDSGVRHPDHAPGKRAAHGYDWFALGGVLVKQKDEDAARTLHKAFLRQVEHLRSDSFGGNPRPDGQFPLAHGFEQSEPGQILRGTLSTDAERSRHPRRRSIAHAGQVRAGRCLPGTRAAGRPATDNELRAVVRAALSGVQQPETVYDGRLGQAEALRVRPVRTIKPGPRKRRHKPTGKRPDVPKEVRRQQAAGRLAAIKATAWTGLTPSGGPLRRPRGGSRNRTGTARTTSSSRVVTPPRFVTPATP